MDVYRHDVATRGNARRSRKPFAKKRPGKQLELDKDGIPFAERDLDPDQAIVRRVCAERFAGNLAAMGRAIGISGQGLRKYIITAATGVTHEMLERVAKATSTTVENLRKPAKGSFQAAGRWFQPGDPDYDLLKRVLIAAKPELADDFDL